jgi:hypothetical protein
MVAEFKLNDAKPNCALSTTLHGCETQVEHVLVRQNRGLKN